MFKVGDLLTAKVMNINGEERRIGLSVKRMEMEDDQSLLNDYINTAKSPTSSFGEILRENLQEKFENNKQEDSEADEAKRSSAEDPTKTEDAANDGIEDGEPEKVELEKIEEDASQETVEDSAQEKTINLGE